MALIRSRSAYSSAVAHFSSLYAGMAYASRCLHPRALALRLHLLHIPRHTSCHLALSSP